MTVDAREIDWGGGAEKEDHRDVYRSPEEQHEQRVQTEVDRERARREARRRLDKEERAKLPEPDIATLAERLARPREEVSWRIEGWQPVGTRVVASSQFKAGKTTFVGNMIRSLVDGDDWLDRAEVFPVSGAVTLLDFEMAAGTPGKSRGQLDDWLEEQGIRNAGRVIVIPMRGLAASFDLLDADVRADWVRRLEGTAYLILDCLRPILDALGLDEHKDVGRFLVALDALLAEAKIWECLVVHHMGHGAERARGDSRLRDWPDVEWRLVRQDEDPSSPRFISAYGRDVDIPESRVLYDKATRHLTLVGGSRKDQKAEAALDSIIELLKEKGEALSGRAIKEGLEHSDHGRNVIDDALRFGIQHGRLEVQPGPRKAKLYRPSVPVSRSVPPGKRDTQARVSLCPTPFIRGGHWDTGEPL